MGRTLKSQGARPDERAWELQLAADEILAVVGEIGGLTKLLAGAADTDRAGLYEAIGICATYDPEARIATLEPQYQGAQKTVSEGGLEPPRPCGH